MDGQTRSVRRRVLVVDDCPDTRVSLASLLRLWGHDVRGAADGPTALETAVAYRPDVVLLDIGLPGMDGGEVARCLRRRGEPALLVSVSGYGDEDHRRCALDAGCDLHWVKPIDLDELRGLLERSPRVDVTTANGGLR